MTSEECPGGLAMAHVGAGLCEDYGPVQGEEAIEEAGPADDVSSDLSTLVVPFPELAPIVFFCLKQTTYPRNWTVDSAGTAGLWAALVPATRRKRQDHGQRQSHSQTRQEPQSETMAAATCRLPLLSDWMRLRFPQRHITLFCSEAPPSFVAIGF
ncbi:hypothetical protein SKAU_G00120310 [Synaphobranchus kaupii]|uniref:Uncharacterized protein n=1 Tax=Synaphobranchus kaupii TaxID=118154 RepID=A0A9Q1J2G2_SYNKA|nr:hypothetical protein SKAU_G00120310 [Synaphobranchus kaupii]